MYNLNTHTLASFYEAYPAEKALKMAQRLEIHYTPKHGSWVNIAEIELSAMEIQCLNPRIDCMGKLSNEINAWKTNRNNIQKTVKWQFTTKDARIKLLDLYHDI